MVGGNHRTAAARPDPPRYPPPMNARRPTVLAALLLTAAALVGCKAAPRTLAESSAQQLEASDFWTARGGATLPRDPAPRVVLTEVLVEFVTSKNQAGERRQAAIMPPHPVLLAASAAGMGRRNVAFGDDEFQAIADRAADALLAELRARGIEPIMPDRAAGAAAFADLETLGPGEHNDVREINLAATDTGRVRSMLQVPVLGARVITADDPAIDAATAALLDELAADAAIRARIRVGVYLERASLEEGSSIILSTPTASTTANARHSLLSDDPVLDETSNGSELVVSPDAYLRAIDATAPAFIRMALDSLGEPG